MLSNIELKKKVEKITNKFQAGLLDEVIVDSKILLKKAQHPVVFNLLSLAFQKKGEFANSVKIMHDALLLNPRNVLHLNNLGMLQIEMELTHSLYKVLVLDELLSILILMMLKV